MAIDLCYYHDRLQSALLHAARRRPRDLTFDFCCLLFGVFSSCFSKPGNKTTDKHIKEPGSKFLAFGKAGQASSSTPSLDSIAWWVTRKYRGLFSHVVASFFDFWRRLLDRRWKQESKKPKPAHHMPQEPFGGSLCAFTPIRVQIPVRE